MESVRQTNKKGERKGQLVISSGISNGNGIAGLLVFGGALVVAGFIPLSSFATNRNKAKAKGKSALSTEPEPKPQQLSSGDSINSQDHDETENTPNNDGDVVSASLVTSDMNITQTLILEEKTAESPNCFVHQEIVLSDDSVPESGVESSSNENGIEEECMFHNSGSRESLKSIQTETNDDDRDDDDDNVVLESGKEEEEEEVEEESSKAAEVTALNSKEEEVRVGEVIEELKGEKERSESDIQSQEAQGASKTDMSASADASHAAGTNVAVTPDASSNEKANFYVGFNNQPSPSHSFQLIIWLMAVLLLLA